MQRFWPRFILKLILAASPRRVMEVGAADGATTHRLLELGREAGFFLDVINTSPDRKPHELAAGYSGGHAFHTDADLCRILELPAADVALLDGDPNYHTVYTELSQLALRAHQMSAAPPLVLIHNVAWPYARRDGYDCPKLIYAGNRHAYAYRGMVPGQLNLVEDGVAGAHANALLEGGPRNGVLTAVEDFIAASGLQKKALFHRLPFFSGLGILVPAERMTEAVRAALESFFAPASLLESCQDLQDELNLRNAELAACRLQMTHRTDALMRTRTIISELEQELADARQGAATGGVV